MLEEKQENLVKEKPDLTGQYAGNTILLVGLILIIVGLFFGNQLQSVAPFAYGWVLVGISTLIRQLRAIYLKLYE